MTQKAAEAGLPLRKVTDLMRYFHNLVQGLPEQEQRRLLLLNGISDPGMIALLEKSNDDFEKSIDLINRHAEATNDAAKADRGFEQQLSRTKNAFDDLFSEVGKHLLPSASSILQKGQNAANFMTYFMQMGDAASLIGPRLPPAKIYDKAAGKWIDNPNRFIPPAQVGAPGAGPLGIRSNNPGNLMPGGHEAIFPTAQAGIGALSRQLERYGNRGWDTLEKILYHYAPPGANNTEAYINAVSKDTGFARGQQLNLSDPSVLKRLIPSIIKHENGFNPYSDGLIQQSIDGAGRMATALPGTAGATGAASKSVSIKIGDVSVSTQATSSADIARGISSHLANEMRNAVTSIDDGVLA